MTYQLGTCAASALSMFSAIALLATSAHAADIHVDVANCPGPGDGSEGNPYCSIQVALDAGSTVDGDKIIVQPGTYFENINFNGKAVTLCSTDPEDPVVVAATIINGNAAGAVVTCDSGEGPDTVLSGFTITNGNAVQGGGMHNSDSSPTVSNCVFSNNVADPGAGGGMFNSNSSPTVTHCMLSGNTCVDDGGGMHNRTFSNPTVTDCVFSNNTACDQGGGMRNQSNSDATVTDCEFIDNMAGFDCDGMSGGRGGGMSLSFATATVTNCSFIGNSAGFDDGTVDAFGGGLHSTHNSPLLINCTFSGNSALLGGATFNDANGAPKFLNCTFIGNSARSDGGGVYVRDGFTKLRNCIFIGNSAIGSGGAVYTGHRSNPKVINCILWNDGPEEIFNADTSTATVSFSNVQGGIPPSAMDKGGNIDADPLFVDADGPDNDPDTFDDNNYRLSAASPCIDAGNNWGMPIDSVDYDEDGNTCELFPVDLDGNPRFNADDDDSDPGCGVPVVIDMGAYEYQFDPVEDVIFADLNGDGVVNATDLAILLSTWGDCDADCCPADLNCDCMVNPTDLATLLAKWS